MPAKVELTEELKQKLIFLHDSGVPEYQIAKGIGMSDAWTRKKLRSIGLAPKSKFYSIDKRIKFSPEEKRKIISLYASGLSVHDVGKEIGYTGDFVHKRLKKWGVRLRGAAHKRKYSLDQQCFSQMTEEAAYFAGLLMADGCIYQSKGKSKNKVISLTSKDKDVLGKFVEFCGSPNRPFIDNKDGTFCVSFSSNKIADDLENIWGVTQKKSFTASVTDPLILYNRHFWRGAVDGDGHVGGKKRKCVYFCSASDNMANAYIEYTDSIGVKTTNYKRKSGFNNIYTGGEDAVRLARVLYTDANVFMDRKMNAAQEMIKKGGDANG